MSDSYFTGINYSMANEDSTLEYEMMTILKPKKIVSVCGSGGRALPLIHPDAQSLTCIDLSTEQLNLLELRTATIRQFSHSEFLKFWGYPPYFVERFTEDRQNLFETLELSEPCYLFFSNIFQKCRWQSLLYIGKWESTFITLSKIAKTVLGKHSERLFDFDNLEDQKKYLQTEFPETRWNFILSVVGNKTLFNALLYKGSFVKKNIGQTYYQFYKKCFKHLMTNDLAKNNFFLQLCFLGEVRFADGCTIEAKKEAFHRMQEGLHRNIKIQSENCDLIQAIQKQSEIDFISMSDVPSYFEGETERNFLQKCRPHLSKGGIIVLRSYLRVPEADRTGYKDISDQFTVAIQNENVGVYKIEVLQRVE